MPKHLDTASALEVKTDQLHIINQFSSSLMQLDTIEELLEYVTSHVVNRLGFIECVIYLADDEARTLKEVASMGKQIPVITLITLTAQKLVLIRV